MPVFQLPEQAVFPRIEFAEPDGLLAVGGDLSTNRLLNAYAQGIFPWYNEGDPILWWSPDPRLVLYPQNLRIAKSMRPIFNQKKYRFTFDTSFREVMLNCRDISRKGQKGTWITKAVLDSYCKLNEMGYAHSVEVWEGEELVGGVYGIALGGCFCGESMFALKKNASKAGFIYMVRLLESRGFTLIDCQVTTDHLMSLGAIEVPRRKFVRELDRSIQLPGLPGSWQHQLNKESSIQF